MASDLSFRLRHFLLGIFGLIKMKYFWTNVHTKQVFRHFEPSRFRNSVNPPPDCSSSKLRSQRAVFSRSRIRKYAGTQIEPLPELLLKLQQSTDRTDAPRNTGRWKQFDSLDRCCEVPKNTALDTPFSFFKNLAFFAVRSRRFPRS
jgi:hypothetical protein